VTLDELREIESAVLAQIRLKETAAAPMAGDSGRARKKGNAR